LSTSVVMICERECWLLVGHCGEYNSVQCDCYRRQHLPVVGFHHLPPPCEFTNTHTHTHIHTLNSFTFTYLQCCGLIVLWTVKFDCVDSDYYCLRHSVVEVSDADKRSLIVNTLFLHVVQLTMW